MPTGQFAANQLVRFVIYENSFFDSYDNYTTTDAFATNLVGLIPDGAAEKEEFITNIAAIAKESIYFVKAPLSEPLGNDNEKRVNYYFRSNIDINYIARTLIGKVFNDTINDAIAAYVVKSYATHGLHERAYEIANSNIKDSINRVNAYRNIGHYTANYNKEKALEYLNIAVELLDILFESTGAESSSIGNTANAYISLSASFSKAGDFEKSLAQKIKVIDDILDKLSDTTTPKRFTAHALIITSLAPATQSGMIHELISAGDLDVALDAAAYAYTLIDALPKGPLATNPYSPHIMYLSNLVKINRRIVNIDPSRTEAFKVNVSNIYENMERYTNDEDTTAHQWMTYYASVAGDVYAALGHEKGLEFFGKIDPDAGGSGNYEDEQREAAFRIANEIALSDGFDAAITFINSYNPLDTSEYSNVTGFGSWGWVDGLTYYNSINDGIGYYAYNHGQTELAKAAADKAVEVLDAGAAYYIATGDQDIIDEELENLVTDSTPSLDGRYSTYGYLKAVKLYISLGEAEAAKGVLDKALAYVNSTSESFARSKSYAVIAYHYSLLGYTSEAESVFAQAAALNADLISGDINKANHYLGLAYDAANSQAADKVNIVKGHLASAITYADLIGIGDSTYDDEVSAFIKIANLFAAIQDNENILSSLTKAEIAAGSILSASIKLAQYKLVFNSYAELGFVDIAFSMATDETLIPSESDRNSAISGIASTVAGKDDFPDSDIAFSDTDKDGKPDFFVPWATEEQIAASGLILDDDTDGDGEADTADLTPFFAN
jgi:hypothetical protein